MSTFHLPRKITPLLSDPKRPFIHRDLSWLQFNARVLDEARAPNNPLLERVKFLSISSSNLDEFFMIRMASLRTSISTAMRKDDKAAVQRLTRIRSKILAGVDELIQVQSQTCEALAQELSTVRIRIVQNIFESETTYAIAKAVFEEKILPELIPPEPFSPPAIKGLENLQLAAVFAPGFWMKIPKKLKPVLLRKTSDDSQVYFFFLDQLLAVFLGASFGLKGDAVIFRLTRDGDLNVDLEEEDTESIPDLIRSTIGKRELGRPVRLQYLGSPENESVQQVMGTLNLRSQQVFRAPKTVCLNGLWSGISQIPDRITKAHALLYPPFQPMIPEPFSRVGQIFDTVRLRDYIFHQPYDSFDSYVNWIREACQDPSVVSIDQTVYRMDALSPVIELLKKAAATKKVRVVIELRARFDELNNMRLADELRKAGVHVHFGFGKLKVHAKVALITRTENGEPRRYTHLSTGNYNAITARQYTDLALLTADPVIGEDARTFFDLVCRGLVPQSFKRLVPAPLKLHRKIKQLIESEISAAKAGHPARIIAKVNALVDESVIENLYAASQAGVKIDLIVRGACSLIPGVPGLSENIRVISIVDRYLEHSRIYYFQNTKALYLSSADWMPRNFFSRLEIAFPVVDEALYHFIEQTILPAYLGDTIKGRELTAEGKWRRRLPLAQQTPIRSQFLIQDLAKQNYRGTALAQDTRHHPPRSSQQALGA